MRLLCSLQFLCFYALRGALALASAWTESRLVAAVAASVARGGGWAGSGAAQGSKKGKGEREEGSEEEGGSEDEEAQQQGARVGAYATILLCFCSGPFFASTSELDSVATYVPVVLLLASCSLQVLLLRVILLSLCYHSAYTWVAAVADADFSVPSSSSFSAFLSSSFSMFYSSLSPCTTSLLFSFTAFLPSTLSMYALSWATSLLLNGRGPAAVAVAAAGVLLGWPFAALAAAPLVLTAFGVAGVLPVLVTGAAASLLTFVSASWEACRYYC